MRSAEIMASGFFVSSTEPASASSSRERDGAMMMTVAPPPPLRSPFDDDGRDDRSLPKFKFKEKKSRKSRQPRR